MMFRLPATAPFRLLRGASMASPIAPLREATVRYSDIQWGAYGLAVTDAHEAAGDCDIGLPVDASGPMDRIIGLPVEASRPADDGIYRALVDQVAAWDAEFESERRGGVTAVRKRDGLRADRGERWRVSG
jgi:hypothetical protein